MFRHSLARVRRIVLDGLEDLGQLDRDDELRLTTTPQVWKSMRLTLVLDRVLQEGPCYGGVYSMWPL
ncbi:hypothetical protein BHM03_00045041 [Ensete ventricosum]|nr:hypothetical protein BHM03_00045041 [Ensete ventricosum]